MARIYLKGPEPTEPLRQVTVYMYAKDRQALREQAAKRGKSMSEYIKHLIAKDREEGL
jgi:hypothetical protein